MPAIVTVIADKYLQLMSFRLNPNGLKIQAGMTPTNEPGYYEDGNFGIRIESVMVVKKVSRIRSCLCRVHLVA